MEYRIKQGERPVKSTRFTERYSEENGWTTATLEQYEVAIEEWKSLQFDKLSYSVKRERLYPPMVDLADAEVKIGSDDPILQEEGRIQKQEYVDACLLVKQTISKEEV